MKHAKQIAVGIGIIGLAIAGITGCNNSNDGSQALLLTNQNPCQVKNNADSGTDSLRGVLELGTCSTITFASSVTDIQLTGYNASTGVHLDIASYVTIDGGSGVTIRGNNTSNIRVFKVKSGATAIFKGLTITGGSGGIVNLGTLTIGAGTSVTGNSTVNPGGGIYNSGGMLTVQGTISGNHADGYGGGIFSGSGGTVTIPAGGQVTGNTAATACNNYYDDTSSGCVIP